MSYIEIDASNFKLNNYTFDKNFLLFYFVFITVVKLIIITKTNVTCKMKYFKTRDQNFT